MALFRTVWVLFRGSRSVFLRVLRVGCSDKGSNCFLGMSRVIPGCLFFYVNVVSGGGWLFCGVLRGSWGSWGFLCFFRDSK